MRTARLGRGLLGLACCVASAARAQPAPWIPGTEPSPSAMASSPPIPAPAAPAQPTPTRAPTSKSPDADAAPAEATSLKTFQEIFRETTPETSQETTPTSPKATAPPPTKARPIGRLHQALHRSEERHAGARNADGPYGAYSRWKQRRGEEARLAWTVDLSVLPQWGWPDGQGAATQLLTSSALDWTLLQGKTLGKGSLQVAYITARYPSGQTATQLAHRLGLLTPINDYPFDQDIFAQLSYTQAFPGDRLLLTVGQFPFYNFDTNQYLFNQQINFNSYLFSQNASATYANAGLGAYGQLTLSPTLQLAAGLQSANSLSGATLTTRGFGEGGPSWFGYAQWTPHLAHLGPAQYSLLVYQVPSLPTQSKSWGWSFNAVQNLNATWALFARANQAVGFQTPIRASVVLGAAMTNPLGRSPTDQLGLALGRSVAAPPPANPGGARSETLLEAYWSWTLFGGVLLTPSVQTLLAPSRNDAWVLNLRATLML
ncbi:MAG: carbohydrate porin [Cyanobacteriota bacterium]|nr:carbohydrate porin [Cyanobacteriota bacterium]